MGLDPEDRTWLDGKFSSIHSRITDSQMECQRETASVRQAFAMHASAPCPGAHPAAPCPDVKALKEETKGDRRAQWTVFGIVMSLIVGGMELLKYLFSGSKH